MNEKLTYEEVFNRFKDNGYLLIDKTYISSKTRMTCVDKEGYKYLACNNLIQNRRKPDPFNKFNPYTLENVENLLKLKSKGSKLLSKEYIDNKMNLEITCEECGCKIIKKWDTIINKNAFKCHNCSNYSLNIRKYNYEFIFDEFKKFGYTIIDSGYVGNNDKINCIDSDGYYVKHKFADLSIGKTPNRFSTRFNEENYIKNINNYFKLNNIDCVANKYFIKNNKTFVELKCECGKIFNTDWASIKSGQIRCSYCSSTMSNIEHKVRMWLDDNCIEYEFQKRFDGCINKRKLPFDFYLPKYNCCIEVDGEQHYYPTCFSKSQNVMESFNERKNNDEIKTKYCYENNIELLRISFVDIKRSKKEYINILSNKFIKD